MEIHPNACALPVPGAVANLERCRDCIFRKEEHCGYNYNWKDDKIPVRN
jgi:hypothetical protein